MGVNVVSGKLRNVVGVAMTTALELGVETTTGVFCTTGEGLDEDGLEEDTRLGEDDVDETTGGTTADDDAGTAAGTAAAAAEEEGVAGAAEMTGGEETGLGEGATGVAEEGAGAGGELGSTATVGSGWPVHVGVKRASRRSALCW